VLTGLGSRCLLQRVTYSRVMSPFSFCRVREMIMETSGCAGRCCGCHISCGMWEKLSSSSHVFTDAHRASRRRDCLASRCTCSGLSITDRDRKVFMSPPMHPRYLSSDREDRLGQQSQKLEDSHLTRSFSLSVPAEHLGRVSREWVPVSFPVVSANGCSCKYPFRFAAFPGT
jgi:hypothetical protein